MVDKKNKTKNCTPFSYAKKTFQWGKLIKHYKIMAQKPSHIKYNFKIISNGRYVYEGQLNLATLCAL